MLKKYSKALAFILTFVIVFTSISFENAAYAAEPPDITRIELQSITETDGSVTEKYLIWGSNFQDPSFIMNGYTIDSSIYTRENSAYVIDRNSEAGNYVDLWQVPDDGKTLSIKAVNSDGLNELVQFSIRVKPNITNISATSKKVYVGNPLTIEGTGFTDDAGDNDIDLVYVSGTLYKFDTNDYTITPEKNIHIDPVKDPHSLGVSDIMVVKDTGDAGFIGKIVGVYKDALTVVKETDIIDPTKMRIIPNTGPIEGGTTVRIFDEGSTTSNLKPDMKIYVDSINESNLFTDVNLILDANDSSKVIGISGVTPPSPTGAQGFFDIIITDKTGSNEQRINNAFTYEEKENLLKIDKVNPISGKANTTVTVKGKNILYLNIPYIENVKYLDSDGSTEVSNLVGTKVGDKLVIYYKGDDKNSPGKKLKVKREIELIIGQVSEILDTDLYVSSTVDEIKVKIPETSETGLVDVTINATTTITDADDDSLKEIREEEDSLVDGFDIIPSVSQPEMTEIQPAKGDVNKKIYITIKGNNFQVLADADLSPIYPQITIGTRQAQVTAVYDDEDNEVNGVGREFGTIIKAFIPEPAPTDTIVPGPVDIRIENPDKGDTIIYGVFEFLNPDPSHTPKINKIDPNIGPLEGGNTIILEGESFAHEKPVPEVIVTIDGQIAKVKNATNTKIEIEVPEGSSIGEKPVQVITEDGAMDTIEINDADREGYTYVRLLSDPEVETIAPSFGGKGTIVYIFGKDKGEDYPNFYKPVKDSSARVEEMIGTRVLLNGIDVNEIEEEYDGDGNLTGGNIYLKTDNKITPDGDGNVYELDLEGNSKSKVTVIDGNILRIKIPNGYTAGLKDVKVLNPDSSTVTVANGFDYKIPPLNADVQIRNVDPNIGSNLGGDYITITGEDFKDGAQVYFGGYKSSSVRVSTEHTLIVKTPAYPLPNPDLESQKDVEVVVVNYDGSSAASPVSPDDDEKPKPDSGYRYMAPKTQPQITSVEPNTGTTLGNELVTIIGQDFRMVTEKADGSPLDVTEYPKVFFGGKEVKEEDFVKSQFKHNKIVVKTPFYGKEGLVDITVKNPQLEFGSVTKPGAFNYRTSNPKISSVFPDRAKKIGGDEITVKGTEILSGDFGTIKKIPSASEFEPEIDVLAIFGDEKLEKAVLYGSAKGTLGDVKVDYERDRTINDDDGNPSNADLIIYHVDDGTDMPLVYCALNPEEREIFVIDWKALGVDIAEEAIVVELIDDTLIAKRRVAPKAIILNENDDDPIKKVEIQTPPSALIGQKNLYIENKDRGWDKTSFEYIHPSSRPIIKEIIPRSEIRNSADNQLLKYYVESTVEGGLYITIDGYDFRQDVEVFIDGVPAPLVSRNVLNEQDSEGRLRTRIVVTSPKGDADKLNKELKIMIINPDGGFVDASDTSKIIPESAEAEAKPYYFVYRIPESSPYIDSILPIVTSQYGGNEIRIVGYDFRTGATVAIGGKACSVVSIDNDEIVVKTPSDLTPGLKDVQVINTDHGTVTKTSAISVISYPEITTVTTEGGDAVERVSIEGGQKIVLSGRHFQSGASVYFGGERKQIGHSENSNTKGLFRDDDYYTIEDAYAAKEVEFVSENQLIVTVPEVFKEGKYTITVLNSDTGLSDQSKILDYRVPIPTDPIGLEAEIVNDKYIRIYGYSSSNASYYEVYACIDEDDPKDDDFKYLDTTEKTSYKITKFKELDDDENIYLRIRAVNKYGPSEWSNIAKISYRELDDIEGIGNEDTDGDLVSDYQESIGSDGVNVVLGNKDLKGSEYYVYVIDLKDKKYDKIDKRIINIPGKTIKNSNKAVLMDNGDTKIQFNVRNFYVYSFINLGSTDQDNTYGRIVFNRAKGKDSDYMQRKIPRKYKLISRVYDIKTEFQMQEKTTKLDSIAGYMDLEISYDENKLMGLKENKLQLYKFDPKEGKWIALAGGVNPDTNQVHARIDGPGHYAILGEK